MDSRRATLLQEVLEANEAVKRKLLCTAQSSWLALDLSLSELKGLLLLANQSVLTVGTIAVLLGVSRSRASLTVDQLVRSGFATRRDDKIDRRRSLVQISAKGEELIDRLFPGSRAALTESAIGLHETQLSALAEGLKALSASIVYGATALDEPLQTEI